MHRKHSSDQQVFLRKSGGHFFRSFIDAIAALQQQSFGALLPSACHFSMRGLFVKSLSVSD